jgi:hypothetical protein
MTDEANTNSSSDAASAEAVSIADTTCGLVEEYLADFGDTFTKVDRGVYFAKKGSTLVGIHVVTWRNDALVHVSANVVKNAKLEAPLMKALLEWNFRSSFGSFGVSPEGTINLRYSLLGSTLEKAQLIPAVLAVAKGPRMIGMTRSFRCPAARRPSKLFESKPSAPTARPPEFS